MVLEDGSKYQLVFMNQNLIMFLSVFIRKGDSLTAIKDLFVGRSGPATLALVAEPSIIFASLHL